MTSSPPHIVIAGGGVAALEALIALHELADDGTRVTLLAPEPYFVYRPMSVAEPFCLGHAERHALAAIVADFGATLVSDSLREVDPVARTVTTGTGETLAYDSLLIAVGARQQPAYRHAITFGVDGAPEALSGLLADLEDGYVTKVAFVVPSTVAWSLPLYELAVMTARDVWAAGIDGVDFVFVTPEARPLEAFGPQASTMVAELLASERIEFIGSTVADVGRGFIVAGDRRIDVNRTIALPAPTGPAIAGLPADTDGFIAVDEYGRVEGVEDVYAAGDATTFPIKQGGLAAQQADAAAEAIVARHGVDLDPQPFRPVLRGMLMTGGQRRWLRAPAGATPGHSEAALRALWWPPTKIASKHLAPYLMGRDEAALLRARPAGAHDVESHLELLARED
ncbi:MAG TPA: FAD-dependent oxidoreductase [Solirubrobacteraceae bacterium]|jgi:sulfide:quinone oxidoreductase|nr:FAD-dependent oxidoreductase [Solirubrobacteraceae bacterium]